jgi:hypothetical protein
MGRRQHRSSHPRFGAGFVCELGEILRSDATRLDYDSSPRSASTSVVPFTEGWTLRSLEFDPESDQARVLARFTAEGREVLATIDAADFAELIGKRSRNPAFNSSEYSDLAVIVSIRLQEQILSYRPDALAADIVRIGHI